MRLCGLFVVDHREAKADPRLRNRACRYVVARWRDSGQQDFCFGEFLFINVYVGTQELPLHWVDFAVGVAVFDCFTHTAAGESRRLQIKLDQVAARTEIRRFQFNRFLELLFDA